MPVTTYLWDVANDSYLMEKDGDGNTTAVYTQEPSPFGALVSQRRGAESRFLHFDALGSVRAVTDATGQITDTYLHDAFGNTIQSSGASFVPYHFVGRSGYYHDEEVSGYYVRARHYDPALGRWRSQDPIAYRGGINLYEYVGDSPLTRIDPDATITRTECFTAIDRAQKRMKAYVDAMRAMKPPCRFLGQCLDNRTGGCSRPGETGGYAGEQVIGGITFRKFAICYERATSVTEAEEWAAHEFVHVFDFLLRL